MTPISSETNRAGAIAEAAVQHVVLEAMRLANLARDSGAQLDVSPEAPIFGPDSALDSLGLVALLLDIEDGLRAAGFEVVLSDERAMSQKRSPFRSVPALIAAIRSYVREHNKDPRPFIWTASASSILRKIKRCKEALETGH